jgi:DNA helicase II / ATP-dependent DNA helicase PcrA
VVERVLENREGGTELKQQAVLFRTSNHSGPLEIELTRRNIPFVKFGGLRFLDTAHVKDLLALLRFVEKPARSGGWLPHPATPARRGADIGALAP